MHTDGMSRVASLARYPPDRVENDSGDPYVVQSEERWTDAVLQSDGQTEHQMHEHDRIADEQMPGAAVFDESVTAWMDAGQLPASIPRRRSSRATASASTGRARSASAARCSTRCLEYALEQRIEHGVWGGCSERERRRILKRRRLSAVPSN